MKIVRRDYVRNGPGSVKMVAVESEDLWLAYNLIAEGDSVLAVTVSVKEGVHLQLKFIYNTKRDQVMRIFYRIQLVHAMDQSMLRLPTKKWPSKPFSSLMSSSGVLT
ncbi:Protein PELOTA like [Actinidia chinensis var. chinensis]|uniref:Protein PELOTA like n=1 Tax=Actinidia chinensis var. chinensis TaxID=1590841 RepID=A0A2R6QAW9_ACTCC|nr:Protein PELOTA like [Actinidia chinensis var. chinensis]